MTAAFFMVGRTSWKTVPPPEQVDAASGALTVFPPFYSHQIIHHERSFDPKKAH
jgi:hypothetical protein